jgi:hypothetical protein
LRERIVGGVESLPEAGAERPIVDGAANLEQEIGPASRPTHLLRFIHPAVYQEIGGAFGDRGADPQSGPVPLGIVDQPVALADETKRSRPETFALDGVPAIRELRNAGGAAIGS